MKVNIKSLVSQYKEIESSRRGLGFFLGWLDSNYSKKDVKTIEGFMEEVGTLLKEKRSVFGIKYGSLEIKPKPALLIRDAFGDFMELSDTFISDLHESIVIKYETLYHLYQKLYKNDGSRYHLFVWLYSNTGEQKISIYQSLLEDPHMYNMVKHPRHFLRHKDSSSYRVFFRRKTLEDVENLSGAIRQYLASKDTETRFLKVDGIPEELVTSFQQYFLFFNEYIEAVKGEKLELEVRAIKEGLEFVLLADSQQEIDKIRFYLNEFFEYARKVIINNESVDLVLGQIEINEFKKLQLEAQINHFQLNLKLKETEIKYLTKENTFLKTLALNFTENNQATITNQFISDGQQQFGSTIQNLKPPTKDQSED